MTEKFCGVSLEEDIIKDFKIIAAKEGSTLKDLHKALILDYVKKHGDGNPAFTLDQWADNSDMKAVPAVFRDHFSWAEYINGLSDQAFKELETQIYVIKELLHKKWQYGDAKMKVI